MVSPLPLNESSKESFSHLVERDAPEHADRIKAGFTVLEITTIEPTAYDYRNTGIKVRYTDGSVARFRYRRLDLTETYGAETALGALSGTIDDERAITLFSHHHNVYLTADDVSVSDTGHLTASQDHLCLLKAKPNSIVYIGHTTLTITADHENLELRFVENKHYLCTEDGRPRILEGK